MGRALTAFLLALVMMLSVVPTAMAAELPTKIDPPAQTDTATQPAEWENGIPTVLPPQNSEKTAESPKEQTPKAEQPTAATPTAEPTATPTAEPSAKPADAPAPTQPQPTAQPSTADGAQPSAKPQISNLNVKGRGALIAPLVLTDTTPGVMTKDNDDRWQVESGEDMQAIGSGQYLMGDSYIVIQNITVTNPTWTPIGNLATPFKGT
ncbi:MAG: hypothetical protein RR873_06405, partial [Christensenella sp.]